MEKLNNKNFWTPLFIASIISILLLFFALPYALLISLKLLIENVQSYGETLLIDIFLLPLFLVIAIPPIFFIIKRLLSDNPKKVFYFELPILIIVYSILLSLNQLFGLMMGGPRDTTFLLFLSLILPQIIVISLWLVLLTFSLYFYYKKKIINRR